MRTHAILLALGAFTALSAQAGLIGSSVNGNMAINGLPINYFDSSNGFVQSGCSNSGLGSTTLNISAATEFCYHDAANTISADFGDTTLALTIVSSGGSLPIVFTFTDSAFIGLPMFETTDNFPTAVGFGISADTLTLNTANFIGTSGTFQATYSFTNVSTSGVPEPSTIGLLGMASGLCAFAARRRFVLARR